MYVGTTRRRLSPTRPGNRQLKLELRGRPTGSAAMNVVRSTRIQILMAWRANKWVVARDNVEVGAYAYRSHATECVRRLAAEAHRAGVECYLLIRDLDGSWAEHPCPRPPRQESGR